jgi:hypothetical protein
MWSTHSRRIDPISRSAKPFCQGEAAAVGFPRRIEHALDVRFGGRRSKF